MTDAAGHWHMTPMDGLEHHPGNLSPEAQRKMVAGLIAAYLQRPKLVDSPINEHIPRTDKHISEIS